MTRNSMWRRAGRVRKSALAVLALVAALAGGTTAVATAASPMSEHDVTAALRADLDRYLTTQGAQDHVSAVSLRVTYQDRRRVVALSAGTTTWGGRTPVSNDALWQIGSNTKAFTSVVLLQLEAEGELSIHDRLGKWLPQYPAWRDVTIRQLLTMTSGIPDYTGTSAWAADIQTDPSRLSTATQLLSYVTNLPLGSTAFHYSNSNYLLAQLVIERASHRGYFDQVTDRIIRPLGLHDTCFAPETCSPRIAPRLPVGYSMQTGLPELLGKPVPPLAVSWGQGAGGLVSTLRDMTTWDRALYNGRLLPAAQQRELESMVSTATGKPIPTVTPDDPTGFGLGVAQKIDNVTGKAWLYVGGTFGYRVIHMYVPNTGALIAIAVNSNPDHDTLPDLANRVYQTLTAY